MAQESLTQWQVNAIYEELVKLTDLVNELSSYINELKINVAELSEKLDEHVDVEAKLKALSVEVSNLKDEKEI